MDENAKNQININKDLLTIEKIFEQKRGELKPVKTELDDCATLVMSSGSTGQPKAIIRTNRNWLAVLAATQHKEVIPLTPDDIFLAGGFCHGCNQRYLFSCINGGAQVAITQMEQNYHVTFEKINKYNVTNAFIVVSELNYLIKNYETYDKNYLKSLRDVITGGSGVSSDLHKTMIDKHGFERFRNGYGMSEMGWSLGVYASDLKNLNNFETIGKVIAGVEAKVIDDHENSLPSNKHGQLCLKSYAVTPGYMNNDIENAKLFTKDGFLKTGDYSYYDDQEYFYIIGRIKEFIKVEAVVVSPAELENILLQNENIENAAVIGIKDEERDEIPMAFVTLVKGSTITAQGIQDFVDNRVNYYKKLRGGVRVIDKFPLTALKKINKTELKRMAQQLL